MANICKPGSGKDLALQVYPKGVCVRKSNNHYIVMNKPYNGTQVAFGVSVERAWEAAAVGFTRTKENYDR